MIFDPVAQVGITLIACREAHRNNPSAVPGDLLTDAVIGQAIVEYFKDTGEWDGMLLPAAIQAYRDTEAVMAASGALAAHAVARLLR